MQGISLNFEVTACVTSIALTNGLTEPCPHLATGSVHLLPDFDRKLGYGELSKIVVEGRGSASGTPNLAVFSKNRFPALFQTLTKNGLQFDFTLNGCTLPLGRNFDDVRSSRLAPIDWKKFPGHTYPHLFENHGDRFPLPFAGFDLAAVMTHGAGLLVDQFLRPHNTVASMGGSDRIAMDDLDGDTKAMSLGIITEENLDRYLQAFIDFFESRKRIAKTLRDWG